MDTTHAPDIERFQQLVQEEWADPTTVTGWRKWFPKMLEQFRLGTDALVREAALERGMKVLDLASGSGDPAIAIATVVGPSGEVTATDGSAAMLGLAADHCRERGLRNVDFRLADAQDLPFPDQRFDRVVSKLGVMYFVDIETALDEVRRVLVPDGRVALLAWGDPAQSPYIQSGLGPILERAKLPPPPPGAPQPFRFAAPGTLSAELRRAGFRGISEQTVMVPLAWPGPPEELWQHLYDIAAPFRPIVDSLEPSEREAAIDEVLARLRQYYDGERTTTPAALVIATALR